VLNSIEYYQSQRGKRKTISEEKINSLQAPLLELSLAFYTLIPHHIDCSLPVLIDTKEQIKKKVRIFMENSLTIPG
jgi:hypothetical protein